jgi:hypothetical protein
VAKLAAAALGAIVAVAALPGLLRAPEPPPLGRDVGLPRVVREKKSKQPRRHRQRDGAFVPHSDTKAPKPERSRPKRARAPEPAAAPEPAPPPEPPAAEPAPEPAPPPPPAPEPAPVEDGSAEFAPH